MALSGINRRRGPCEGSFPQFRGMLGGRVLEEGLLGNGITFEMSIHKLSNKKAEKMLKKRSEKEDIMLRKSKESLGLTSKVYNTPQNWKILMKWMVYLDTT